MKNFLNLFIFLGLISCSLQKKVYQTPEFTLYEDGIKEGSFTAQIFSPTHITSDYESQSKIANMNKVEFKLAVNGKDNERGFAKNHYLYIQPENGKYLSPIYTFGVADTFIAPATTTSLIEDIMVTIRVDMRHVLQSISSTGKYLTETGDTLTQKNMKGIFIVGGLAPLQWNFETVQLQKEKELTDPDGDGIYEISLTFPKYSGSLGSLTRNEWKLSKDISQFPTVTSSVPLISALHNLSAEELLESIREDGAFMAGALWPGIWTRDISYSIWMSLAYLHPEASKKSLRAKVKNGRIIQDTGTGGSWPVSTDRVTWIPAAYEIYLATNDERWKEEIKPIIYRTLQQDLLTGVVDTISGAAFGESSFLDWREQSYPKWMDSKDIFHSVNLGTAMTHVYSYQIAAILFPEQNERFNYIAKKITDYIQTALWHEERGFYQQFTYGRGVLVASPRFETLGEALVLLNQANSKNANKIFEATPYQAYGIPVVYPQSSEVPPYHNNAVWPFVQAYFTWASAYQRHLPSVEYGLSVMARSALLFLTNKENLVASTGDFVGTELNSDRQLWSVAGQLAMTYRVLLGMSLLPSGVTFHPMIPKSYSGELNVENLKIQGKNIQIKVKGYGDGFTSAKVNGKKVDYIFLPEDETGDFFIEIEMNNQSDEEKVKFTRHTEAPKTPMVKINNSQFEFVTVDTGVHVYPLIFSLANQEKATDDQWKVFSIYSRNSFGVESYISEPISFPETKGFKVSEAEQFSALSENKYYGYSGKGYVPISLTQNRTLNFSIQTEKEGLYRIDMKYANGNGPINTENKCAIRSLYVNGKRQGVIIFPQRGDHVWTDWGYSSWSFAQLKKGENKIQLIYEPHNENMNGEVNTAHIDYIRWAFAK